jgi:mono/diheme cytochrome c family protein
MRQHWTETTKKGDSDANAHNSDSGSPDSGDRAANDSRRWCRALKPCAVCHSANGSGDTAAFKSMKVHLRSSAVQKQTDIELTKVISGGKGKMPAYEKKMSTADIQTLLAYIRTLK